MFPINWERLDAGVFTPTLTATKRKSRTFATRETYVISERKHCSRRRRHTQVELSSPRTCADKTQTIARKRWHGARKRKRSNVRSTCGRLKRIVVDSSWTCGPQCIGSFQVLCQRIVVDSSWTCDPQCIGSLQVLCQRIVVMCITHNNTLLVMPRRLLLRNVILR